MQSQSVKELFEQAKKSFERKDFRTCITLLDELIDENPNHSEAYFLLANIAHMRGEIGKALKGFRKVLQLAPNHTDAAISLSVLLNDIGKYKEAQVVFEKANSQVKKNESGFVDPHINKIFAFKHAELAELYASYRRYDEALFEYNKAIGLNPDLLELRIKVAKLYKKKGFSTKSKEVLRQLKAENPGFIPAKVALGLFYYGEGQVLEAQSEWQSVLEKDPSHKEALMYLDLSKNASETEIGL